MKVQRMTRRSFGYRCVAFIAVAVLLLALPTPAFADKVRVMVDPGHGGKDPGAIGGSLQEKRSNLQISKLVVKAAKRQGWKVGMTRRTDKFISLNERPRRAARFKADVMVSIHSNSVGRKPMGNMTIYRGKSSKRLGKKIMKELKPLTDYKDIGNRRDVRGLALLRGAQQPTVIVELLSVSARSERKKLKNPKEQREMAEAIVKGIAKFEGKKYKAPKSAQKAKKNKTKTETPKQAETTTAPAETIEATPTQAEQVSAETVAPNVTETPAKTTPEAVDATVPTPISFETTGSQIIKALIALVTS